MMGVSSRPLTEFFWLLAAGLGAWLLLAYPALAQSGVTAGDFLCRNGVASGFLYEPSQTCPTTLKFDNIFSFLVCNMEHLAANLMGSMYCGVLYASLPGVEAALTLAVVFFGIGFTTGVIPATAREFQLFMIKIAMIWVLATNAEYLINVGYRFLVEGAREGIVIALSGVFAKEGGATATGADIYEYLDKFLGKALEYAVANVGVDWERDANPCQNAIFAVIAMMMVVFPPLFYVSVALMFKVGLTFLRAVFGYIYALVGIVFLLTMAPLFLSFYLFRQTQPFFNKWLGYLVSFTLQMVIVFAFLGAVVSIDVKHITSSFVNIIVPNKQVPETTSFRFPWEYCTVCDFEVVDTENSNTVIDPGDYGSFLGRGALRCKQPVQPISPMDTLGAQTSKDDKGGGGAPTLTDKGNAIRNSLLQFTATALLSLFVLAYVVDALLRYVPALAQYIAGGLGGTYAPQLGGGDPFGAGRATAEMSGNRMLSTIEHGFTDGYVSATNRGEWTPGAVVGGFREAAARMVTGGRTRTGEVYDRFSGTDSYNDPGLVDSFFNFFINPHGDNTEG